MLLENNQIRLRALEPEDLNLLYKWENDPSLWDVGNTRNPYSLYALKQYIQQSAEHDIYENKQLRLMIEELETGTTVGTVDLFDFEFHHSRVALGLFVDPDYQGRGYATSALRLVEEYVFQFLSINQLYCHISENNTASVRMFQKENFHSSCILINWIKTTLGYENVIVFQQFREEFLMR